MSIICKNLYSSTDSEILFELERYPSKIFPDYYTLNKTYVEEHVMDKSPISFGSFRIFTYCIHEHSTMKLMNSLDFKRDDFDAYIQEIKQVPNGLKTEMEELPSNPPIIRPFIEQFGKEYVLVFEDYFLSLGYDGIFEENENRITLFQPEKHISLISIESDDSFYIALVQMLKDKNPLTPSLLEQYIMKYEINDIQRLLILDRMNSKFKKPEYYFSWMDFDSLLVHD